MNRYLTAARDRYAEHATAIEALQNRAAQEGRELTGDELRSVCHHGDAAKLLFDEIEQLSQYDVRTAQVEAMSALVAGAGVEHAATGAVAGAAPADGGDTLPPLLPSRDEQLALRRAITDGRSERFTVAARPTDVHTRATVTLALTGTPVAPMVRAFMEPRRLATGARLPVTTVAGASNVTYPLFGAGSAEITAEGVLKQEYSAITAVTSTPQLINVWTDFTRQVDLSMAGFEQRLRSKLAALVAAREDKLLIATALAATLPTFAKGAGVPRSDALLQAAGTILGAVGMAPNVAVVNTADMAGIFTGSVGAGGESPEEELRLAVRGMAVYPSPDIATGTALVGAWPAGSSLIVGLPPTYLVDAVSGIKNNKITVLLEEAVQLAIDDLGAFVKITTFTN